MTAIETASSRIGLELRGPTTGRAGAWSRLRGRTALRFGDPDADLGATVEVHSPRFYRAMLGSVGLGEAYRDGVWDCDDLVA